MTTMMTTMMPSPHASLLEEKEDEGQYYHAPSTCRKGSFDSPSHEWHHNDMAEDEDFDEIWGIQGEISLVQERIKNKLSKHGQQERGRESNG